MGLLSFNYASMAQRRIGALQIYLSVCYQIFHYLAQIETHPRLYAETNVQRKIKLIDEERLKKISKIG